MRYQGSIEYVIILGLIILITFIIISNINGLNIASFKIGDKSRTSEINLMLNEVSVRYSLSFNGLLQASAIVLSASDIEGVNLTFKQGDDECRVHMQTNYKHWSNGSNACSFLTGVSGDRYSFNCSVSYLNPDTNLVIKKSGVCFGVYEEVNSNTFFWVVESSNDFNDGSYINTSFTDSVNLDSGFNNGLYDSKVFDAGVTVNWSNIDFKTGGDYKEEWVIDDSTMLLNHLNNGCSGVLNSAECFSDSFIDLGNDESIDFSTDDFSVSLWFRVNNISGTQSIIDKGTGSYVDGYGLALMSDGRLNFITDGNNDSGAKYYLYSDYSINKSEWYHVVIERSSSVKRMFINNVLQSSTQFDNRELSNPSRHLFIGKADVDSNQFFNGSIDEVIIFNKALNDNEVRNLYERGVLSLESLVRSCDDSVCSGESWTNLPVINNRFFQFRFLFRSNDSDYSPSLNRVVIAYEKN